jgi:hypothetical protein
MQIASQCRQRRLYGGWDKVLTFTGGNILVFLSMCREIWDIWSRATAKSKREEVAETISPEVQSQAVWLVSNKWLDKIAEFPGGDERRKFIIKLGGAIRRALLADKGLVYPGHTGFSVLQDEYEDAKWKDVKAFLDEARDYGDLLGLPHTTKEKDRRARIKWYLNPILCPHFEIPGERTKEPFYASLNEVHAWLSFDTPIVWRRPYTERRTVSRKHGRGTTGGQQEELF